MPRWLEDPVSKERAEALGLTDEPECPACAQWIYCGTVIDVEHDCGRTVATLITVAQVAEINVLKCMCHGPCSHCSHKFNRCLPSGACPQCGHPVNVTFLNAH